MNNILLLPLQIIITSYWAQNILFNNGIDTMDSNMALKDHSSFKYVHGNKFLG